MGNELTAMEFRDANRFRGFTTSEQYIRINGDSCRLFDSASDIHISFSQAGMKVHIDEHDLAPNTKARLLCDSNMEELKYPIWSELTDKVQIKTFKSYLLFIHDDYYFLLNNAIHIDLPVLPKTYRAC